MARLRGSLLPILAGALVACGSSEPDPGVFFGETMVLNVNATTDSGDDTHPQIATDGAGTWLAVWSSSDSLNDKVGLDPDIFVARSVDNGVTWTAPSPLNTDAAGDAEFDYEPHLATDRAGNWVVVWMSVPSLGSLIRGDPDILISRSADNGRTWTAQATLDPGANTDSSWEQSPQIATDETGHWLAVWESDRMAGVILTGGTDIFFAVSTDNGATWTAPAMLNVSATTLLAEDVAPQIVTDRGGSWVAVWTSDDLLGAPARENEYPDFEVLVSHSTDNGATWTAAEMLNNNGVSDVADDGGPRVATDGRGNWVAVWSSDDSLGGMIGDDADILVARSTDSGATWTAPEALNGNAASDMAYDSGPQVMTDGAGNWVALWWSDGRLGGSLGENTDILMALSTDNGVTWTAPVPLNAQPFMSFALEFNPDVATDRAGQWMAVWQSLEFQGVATGPDTDLMFSVGKDRSLLENRR